MVVIVMFGEPLCGPSMVIERLLKRFSYVAMDVVRDAPFHIQLLGNRGCAEVTLVEMYRPPTPEEIRHLKRLYPKQKLHIKHFGMEGVSSGDDSNYRCVAQLMPQSKI